MISKIIVFGWQLFIENHLPPLPGLYYLGSSSFVVLLIIFLFLAALAFSMAMAGLSSLWLLSSQSSYLYMRYHKPKTVEKHTLIHFETFTKKIICLYMYVPGRSGNSCFHPLPRIPSLNSYSWKWGMQFGYSRSGPGLEMKFKISRPTLNFAHSVCAFKLSFKDMWIFQQWYIMGNKYFLHHKISEQCKINADLNFQIFTPPLLCKISFVILLWIIQLKYFTFHVSTLYKLFASVWPTGRAHFFFAMPANDYPKFKGTSKL